jgi:hypothetical protein
VNKKCRSELYEETVAAAPAPAPDQQIKSSMKKCKKNVKKSKSVKKMK